MKKIGVSACLLGHNVRYDGTNKMNNELIELIDGNIIIPICPEVLAGLSTPRTPFELVNNRDITIDNKDITNQLLSGSNIALEKVLDCDFVILKSKSPSCGYKKIYDGSFSSKLIEGNGIFTNLLISNKIKVFSEEDFDEISLLLK